MYIYYIYTLNLEIIDRGMESRRGWGESVITFWGGVENQLNCNPGVGLESRGGMAELCREGIQGGADCLDIQSDQTSNRTLLMIYYHYYQPPQNKKNGHETDF